MMMETSGSQLPSEQPSDSGTSGTSPPMSAPPPITTTAVTASPSLERASSIPSSPFHSSSSSLSAAAVASSASPLPAPAPPPSLKPRRSTTQSSSPRRYDGCVFSKPGSASTRWRLTYHREGTYSEVYIGQALPPFSSSSPATVALKVVKEEGGGNLDAADKRKMLLSEARILHSLQSTDAVCRLYHRPREGEEEVQYLDADGRERGRQPLCIVMSLLLCDMSELRKAGQLSRSAMWEAFLLMFQAMRAVHAGGILHRDVKPSNFGLSHDNHSTAASSSSSPPSLRAFILDFGQSAYAFEGADSQVANCPTSFKGKSYFASIARLEGRRQGRSDDVIMLIYIALDFLVGLPWKDTYDRREKMEDRGREEILRCKRDFSAAAADCDAQGEAGERELLRLLNEMEAVPAEDEPPYARMEEELRRGWREEAAKGGKTLQECVNDFLKQSEKEKAAADAEREREREEKERRRKSRRERDGRGQATQRAKDELTVDTKRAQQQQLPIAPTTASPLPSSSTPHSARVASPLPAESAVPLLASSSSSAVRSLTAGTDFNTTVDMVLGFYAIPITALARKAVSALLQHTAPSDLMLQQYQQSVAVFLNQHPSVPSALSSLFPASLSLQPAPADVFVVMCAEMLLRLRWQTAEEQEKPGAALRVVQEVLSAYAAIRDEKELQRRVQSFLQDRQSGRQASSSGWSSSSTLGGRTLVKKPHSASVEKDRQPPPPPAPPAVRQSASVVDRWMTHLPKKPLSLSRTTLKPATASSPSLPTAAGPHPAPSGATAVTTTGAAAPTSASVSSSSSSQSSSTAQFKSPPDAGRRIPRKHTAESTPTTTAAASLPAALSIDTDASSGSPAVSPRRPSSPPAVSPRPRASSATAAATPASSSTGSPRHAPSPPLTAASASSSPVSSLSSTAISPASAETLAKRAAKNASALSKQRRPLTSAILEMKKRASTADAAPASDGREEAKDDRQQQQEEQKDDGGVAIRPQGRTGVRKLKKPVIRSEDEDGEAEMPDTVAEQDSGVNQPSSSAAAAAAAASSASSPVRQLDSSTRVRRMVRESLQQGVNAVDYESAAFQLAEKVRARWKGRWYDGVVITIDHSAELLRLSRDAEMKAVLDAATGREEDDFPIRGVRLLLRDYRSPEQLSPTEDFCYLIFFPGFKAADPLWYAESWMRRAGEKEGEKEMTDGQQAGRKRARGGGRKDGPAEKKQAVEAVDQKAEIAASEEKSAAVSDPGPGKESESAAAAAAAAATAAPPASAEASTSTDAKKEEEASEAASAAAAAGAAVKKKEADAEQQQQAAEAAPSSSESSMPAALPPRPHIPRKRSLRSEAGLPTVSASVSSAPPQQHTPAAAAAEKATPASSSASSSPPEPSAAPPPSSLAALFTSSAAATVSGSPPAAASRKRRKTEVSELESDQVSFAFQSAKSAGDDDQAMQALKPTLERPGSAGSVAGRRGRKASAASTAETKDEEQKEEQHKAADEVKEQQTEQSEGEEAKQQQQQQDEVDIMSPIPPTQSRKQRLRRR